jgi:hypothetical protein
LFILAVALAVAVIIAAQVEETCPK